MSPLGVVLAAIAKTGKKARDSGNDGSSVWAEGNSLKTLIPLTLILLALPLNDHVFAQTSQDVYQGPLISVHEHFALSSGSYRGSWNSEREVVSQMDQAGITKMVAFASSRYIGTLKRHPDRLIPFFMFQPNVSPEDVRAVELTRQALDAGFVGIGEVLCRHSKAGSFAADNPVMKQIADLAARRSAVVNIHQEINSPKFGPEMIPEFERLLDYGKNVTFIWAHSGYARPLAIASLMSAHSNLYADLSIRTPRFGGGRGRSMIADEAGRVFPEWRALFERFPDRFMFGTDMQPGFPSDFIVSETSYFRKVLGRLPLDLAQRIGYGNFQRIMKLETGSVSLAKRIENPSMLNQVLFGTTIVGVAVVVAALIYRLKRKRHADATSALVQQSPSLT